MSQLREDKCDLALTPHRADEADIAREAIRREPLVVALSDRHPLASAAGIDLAELRDEVFEGWPASVSPGYHAAVVTACHAAGFEPMIDETSTGSTAWNNIAAGRGVALHVASAAPQLPHGIAVVPLRSPPAHIILDAIWPRDNESPAIRRFIDTVRRVRDQRAWV